MRLGKQESEILVLGLARPSCLHVQMEKEVLEQLGPVTPNLHHHSPQPPSTPIIKNKDGFLLLLLLLLSFSYPPSTHSDEGSEVGERVGAVGGSERVSHFKTAKNPTLK